MAMNKLFKPHGLRPQHHTGLRDAEHLPTYSVLVTPRADGRGFTRACDRHQRASLTVSDPMLIESWECRGCADEREDTASILRYASLQCRLIVGLVE